MNESRPAASLEATIKMVRVLVSIDEPDTVVSHYELCDILYHLENFEKLLDWLDKERNKDNNNEQN